jgi:hypothetical protein
MTEIGHRPDGFPRAFEAAFARLQVRLEEACASSKDWPVGVAAAIRAALDFAATDPKAANILTNEAMAKGRDGIARRQRLLSYLGRELSPGRHRQSQPGVLPPVTEQALAGGVMALVAERIATGRVSELPSLAPEAIEFVLTPYLGHGEARRIATTEHP